MSSCQRSRAIRFLQQSHDINESHTYTSPGSFGATPSAITKIANYLREQSEARPDTFILYAYPQLLDKSREAVASLLNVPVDTCVFVANATTGVNTVLRNIVWNDDGKDEILYFSTIYAACGNTVTYVSESTGKVMGREIKITYPLSHASYIAAFEDTIAAAKAEGKRPRLAIFDTVSSVPGVRVPHEELLRICASNSILSMVDAAHGVGHIPLDLSLLQPDFLVSNCHKWLFVPRGCAVLHVPFKNQHFIRSTLPTSHGFAPRGQNPQWTTNFEFVGTVDYTPFCCVSQAIKWRQEVCGGEETIFEYCNDLLGRGTKIVADALGGDASTVLQNENLEEDGDLQACLLSMVRLPISGVWDKEEAAKILAWLKETMIREYKTFIFFTFFQGAFYVRLSAQVYLDEDDFKWAGEALKSVCARVKKGEWEGQEKQRLQVHDVEEAKGKAVE